VFVRGKQIGGYGTAAPRASVTTIGAAKVSSFGLDEDAKLNTNSDRREEKTND
jgi:hypothetical protein